MERHWLRNLTWRDWLAVCWPLALLELAVYLLGLH